MSQTSLDSTTEQSGPRWSGTWPRSGCVSSGIAYQQRPSAPLTDVIGSSPLLLPTPRARVDKEHGRDGKHWGELRPTVEALLPTPTAQDGDNVEGESQLRRNSPPLNAVVRLLPTPNASLQNYDEDPEQFLARREKLKERHNNGNGIGLPLGVAVKLLPTPRASQNEARQMKRTPSQEAGTHGRSLGAEIAETVKLLPTPTSASYQQGGTAAEQTAIKEILGVFESTGESTDPPSNDGKPSTGLRLSPLFVGWMMGTPSCNACGREWTDPDCRHSVTAFTSTSASSPLSTSSSARGSG